MASTDDLGARLQPGSRVGRYEIVSCVGRGGMGVVYRARDARFRRDVAIKVLPADFADDDAQRRRFLRTTEDAARVVHPYVATTFEVVDRDEGPALVMEFVEGVRFDSLFRGHPLEPERAARYGAEIAEALVAIHGAGIVHRDLKPGNILVTPQDHVKVLDFGVAWRMPEFDATVTSGAESSRLTASGNVVGTVAYMSPEQLRGRDVEPRSDLFSLGIVLYEALTGAHPFPGSTAAETAAAILHQPPGPAEARRALDRTGPTGTLVLRMLEKEPERRPESAEAVLRVLRGSSTTDSRRFSPWVVVAAVVVAATFTIGLLKLNSASKPNPPIASSEATVPFPESRRAVVAVLPFEATGRALETARGDLVADWLATTLAESAEFQVLPMNVARDRLGVLSEARIENAGFGLGVAWVLTGRLYEEDGTYASAATLSELAGSRRSYSFQARATRATAIAEDLARQIRRSGAVGPTPGFPTSPTVLPGSGDDALALVTRAQRALWSEDLRAAIDFADRALSLEPEQQAAIAVKADALLRAGFEQRATVEIRRMRALLQRLDPEGSSRAALESECLAARMRSGPDEIRALRRLVERYPDEPAPRLALARAQLRRGFATDALAGLDLLQDWLRDDPSVLVTRGQCLVRLQRPSEAKAAIDAARRLFEAEKSGPGVASAHEALAFVLQTIGELRASTREYETAERLFRQHDLPARAFACLQSQADNAVRLWQLDVAETRYRLAATGLAQVGNASQRVRALSGLGGTLLRLGRVESADDALRAAVTEADELASPGLGIAPTLNRCWTRLLTGRSAEAEADARRVEAVATELRREGDVLSAKAVRAVALRVQGRFNDAESLLRDALAAARSSDAPPARLSSLLHHLAETLEIAERPDDALRIANEAVRALPADGAATERAFRLALRARLRTWAADESGALRDLEEAEAVVPSEDTSLQTKEMLAFTRTYLGLPTPSAESQRGTTPGGVSLDSGRLRWALAAGYELDAAEAHARAVRFDPWSSLADRVRAGLVLSEVLCVSGRQDEGSAVARAALAEAKSASLGWSTARASELVLRCRPSEPADREVSRDLLENFGRFRRRLARGRPAHNLEVRSFAAVESATNSMPTKP